MSGSPKYLRARQIAEVLGVSVRTVRRWIADGTLSSVKIGGTRVVADTDLLRLLQPPEQGQDPHPLARSSSQSNH